MHFYLIGNSYKKTPISLRNDLYRKTKEMEEFVKNNFTSPVALFLTCNRIEFYAVAQNQDVALKEINLFAREFPDFLKYSYIKLGDEEVLKHMLSLAAGLDSQLQGEAQILDQINSWRASKDNPQALRDLWGEILPLANGIRSLSGLAETKLNIANIVFTDINRNFNLNKHLEIVVLGTGKIAELISKYVAIRRVSLRGRSEATDEAIFLEAKKIASSLTEPALSEAEGFAPRNDTVLNFVAHKNYVKAQALAENCLGQAFKWGSLEKLLINADVLISATKSPHYVLKKEDFVNIVDQRKNKLLIYDLALPLDIDSETANIDGIKLQNTKDLDYIFAEFNTQNINKIRLAEYLVQEMLRGQFPTKRQILSPETVPSECSYDK